MICAREFRLLKELVENDQVSVKDLRSLIGAQNPAQIKMQLVEKGWDIQTGYNDILDRDGCLCRCGYYFLKQEERERARIFLEEDRAAVNAAPSRGHRSKLLIPKTTNHHIEGGQ